MTVLQNKHAAIKRKELHSNVVHGTYLPNLYQKCPCSQITKDNRRKRKAEKKECKKETKKQSQLNWLPLGLSSGSP